VDGRRDFRFGPNRPEIGSNVMSLHTLFGKHVADVKASRWDRGRFVSQCTSCGADMIKQPGLDWQLRKAGTL
jgi:hypothetical protein